MNLDKEFKLIQDKVDKLQEQADTLVQPCQKFKPYTDYKDRKYNWSYKNSNSFGTWDLMKEYYFISSNSWDKERLLSNVDDIQLKSVLEHFDQVTARWESDNKEILEYNTIVKEHNQKQYDNIIRIMEVVGIKTSHTTYGYKTSRSRKMTSTTTQAGFVQDIQTFIPRHCGYKTALNNIKQKRKEIEDYGNKLIQSNKERIRKEEQERTKKEAETRKIKVVSSLIAKYDLDYESEPEDVLYDLISRCKYLYLAHYLLLNRGDWSDGYDYAETGLRGFDTSEDDGEDTLIHKEISNICNKMDVDGRYFRDCTYNYDYLFSKVKEDLLGDYNLIKEFIEE